MSDGAMLSVRDLRTSFSTEDGVITAVDGVTFDIGQAETVGVVGESGCGKSVTAESIMQLHDRKSTHYAGEILFDGTNLLDLRMSRMRSIRGNDVAMIFQDPISSLNPVYTVGDQIVEAIMIHQDLRRHEARSEALNMLKSVGIPAPLQRLDEYPHQLSGGMRQRVMIAMALSCRPRLLIADEPTTALDVTVQAQILDLIADLGEQYGMSVMFITHDLAVVAETCSRVIVMYLGQVIESGTVDQVFNHPRHPYTRGLLRSVPRIDGDRGARLPTIEGTVPALDRVPSGCRFAPRCAFVDDICTSSVPTLDTIQDAGEVRCWRHEAISAGDGERGMDVR